MARLRVGATFPSVKRIQNTLFASTPPIELGRECRMITM